MARTHALYSHHQYQTLTGDAGPVTGGVGVEGSGLVRWVSCRIRYYISSIYRYICSGKCMRLVIVAPPIVMGA